MDPKKTDEAVNKPPEPGQPQPSQPVVTEHGKEPVPPTLQSFLNQPQAQKPVEAHHTHRFFTWILITLVILLLIVAGVIAYFIFQEQSILQSPAIQPQNTLPAIPPTEMPIPTEVPSPTEASVSTNPTASVTTITPVVTP